LPNGPLPPGGVSAAGAQLNLRQRFPFKLNFCLPFSIVATLRDASKSGIVRAQIRSAAKPALRHLLLDPGITAITMKLF
jgi:hypothetical protein